MFGFFYPGCFPGYFSPHVASFTLGEKKPEHLFTCTVTLPGKTERLSKAIVSKEKTLRQMLPLHSLGLRPRAD